MGRYLLGRLAYAALVLLGVHLATFLLFFAVNTPDDMARLQLGGKRVSAEQVALWKRERGYDKPLFWNAQADGVARLTDTVYARHAAPLLALRFGRADSESAGDIGHEVARRMVVSVQLAAPLFGLQLLLGVGGALWWVARRERPAARWADAATLLGLSVSSLFVIVIGQHLIARVLKLAPVSGYAEGWAAWRFLLLPLGLALLARLPAELRLYRALLLEEAGKPHVRAALARGLSQRAVLLQHVLRNAGLPLLTAAAAGLPAVFMGSLVFESFFGLPGLGAYAIEAIAAQDFAVVRSLVFLGALLYLAATLLVDAAYAWVDPRVKLGGDVGGGSSSGEGA